MQLDHRLAQLGDGRVDRRVGAGKRLGDAVPTRLLEVVPGREQVLDRVVVKAFRQRSALPLAGAERLGDQSAAPFGELGERPRTLLEHRREQHRGEPDPEQIAGLHAMNRVAWGCVCAG